MMTPRRPMRSDSIPISGRVASVVTVCSANIHPTAAVPMPTTSIAWQRRNALREPFSRNCADCAGLLPGREALARPP